MAREIGIRRIQCFGDSNLVVQQVSGNWDAKDANMASYRFHVQQISGYFEGCKFLHLRREENQAADMLSKLGSSRKPIPPGVSLEHLRSHPSNLIQIPSQYLFRISLNQMMTPWTS